MAGREIEYLPLDEIRPDPRNPRRHESLPDVRASVDRLGFIEPIVRDERTGQLVAGHGRVEVLTAMRESGAAAPDGVTVLDGTWLVPVVVGWASRDDEDAATAVITLNRTSETSGWDEHGLLALLEELDQAEAGLRGSGFTEEAVAALRRFVEASEGTSMDAAAMWAAAGMPEYESADLKSAFKTTVHFNTMEDADAFFKMMGRKRASWMYWPEPDGHVGMDTSRQWVAEPVDAES